MAVGALWLFPTGHLFAGTLVCWGFAMFDMLDGLLAPDQGDRLLLSKHAQNQRALLEGWVAALGKVLFPAANTFSVDFHPIPYRGDPTGLDRHYIPCRGTAGPSVQTFFALEQESRCLCYANANLTRGDQHGELMRFVEFWHTLTDNDPRWLYFDSKLVDYAELSRVNQRGIHFITIRRRGAGILRRLETLPRSGWTGTVLDTPQRCHQRIRYVNEIIKLRGYEGSIRQLAVDGLGREKPTLFLSNHFEETARNLIIRYAGQPRGRRAWDQRGLFSSRLLGKRSPAQCGFGRDDDRAG